MRSRSMVTVLLMALGVAGGVLVRAGQQGQGQAPSQFPLSNSIREAGSSVTGAYEGWYSTTDGSVRLLVGYFNRNTRQELDIPVGPNNAIEPGGPDQGQPTHFLTGRQWGVFSIKAPKGLGTKKLTWVLTANGQTNVITLHTAPDWVVEPYEDAASKNTPPVLRFQPNGSTFSGPPAGLAATYSTTMSNPVALTTWITDEGPKVNVPETPPPGQTRRRDSSGFPIQPPPPLSITWSKYRGPGTVTFENAKPPIDNANGGKATTSAAFSAPGEYLLRAQLNDQSGQGGGGFQCCWTNAHVAVAVRSPSSQ